jgi:CcmD family protein
MNNYLLAAYGIMWLMIFGYVFSIDQRHVQLQKELARLRQILEKAGKQD